MILKSMDWQYLADRYKEHNLISVMFFISRLINKRIANLISRFNKPQLVYEIENDFPIKIKGDHHRYFI